MSVLDVITIFLCGVMSTPMERSYSHENNKSRRISRKRLHV